MSLTIAPAETLAEFRMPSLGADMEYGTLVTWHVKPGDEVKRGDVVAEVETQKGVFDTEIPFAGTVAELLVPEHSRAPVGAVLARVRVAELAPTAAPTAVAARVAAPAAPAPAPPPPPRTILSAAPIPPVIPPALTSARLRVSPLARRIAQVEGVDLTRITGTGAGGAITRADVERALEALPHQARPAVASAPVAPAAPTADARTAAMRQAVAAAVARSKREIPHYYLSTDIDLAKALDWLAAENARRAVAERVLPAVLLLKAVALGLRKHPTLNGFWIDGAPRPSSAIHVGVAVSLRGGGLIAPAIHDADRLSLPDLMRALIDLVRRTRAGGLRSSEMTDPTITVSNLGDEGVGTLFGVIYPPQVALVGFGRITHRPWAVNGLLGVRPVVTATLAADHRATDGHYGALFLAEVDRLLQVPEGL